MTIIQRGKIVRADQANWDGKTATSTRPDTTGGTVTGLAIGNEVDVLQVYGSGTNRTRGTISAALQRIAGTNVTLVFAPGIWTIDDDLTISSNFISHIPAGCVFDISSGKTLTFNGPVFRESDTWTSGAGTAVGGGVSLGFYHDDKLNYVSQDIPLGGYTIPADFSNPLNAKVFYDGVKFRCDYGLVDSIDFTKDPASTHTVYYLDYQTGDDADSGLTEALAVKTMDHVLDLVIALNAPAEVVIIDEWMGYQEFNITSKTVTDSLKIRSGSPSGKTLITQKRESYSGTFNWTDNTDGTFESDVTQADHSACFDDKFRDSDGGARPMQSVASGAACVAAAGSFFWDGVDTMMVHMFDAREPDEDWLYCSDLTSVKMNIIMDNNAGVLIFEDLIGYGNNDGTSHSIFSGRCADFTGASPNTARLGLKNCMGYGAAGDGIAFTDFEVMVLENCRARYCHKDGFNYHTVDGESNGTYVTVYEVDCEAYDLGWDEWKNQVALGISQNGSTCHDNMNILRVNCSYARGIGPVVADVNSCDSLCYGVRATNPGLTAADLPNGGASTTDRKTNAAFYCDGVTDHGTPNRMMLIGCSGDDVTDGDAAANAIVRDGTLQTVTVSYWQGKTDVNLYGEIVDSDGVVINDVL